MPAPPAPARRVDSSMALLVDLMAHAEDPAYADAAARATAPAPRRALAGGALVLVLGLLAGTAVATVRAGSADRGPGRAELAQQVRRRTASSDALAAQAQALRTEVAARRAAALGGAEAARLAPLELASATTAVTGPGVVAELDDRPAGEQGPDGALPRGAQAVAGRVLDRDLQRLVNGLWAAGAEAVSVNDLRLTARTAIRSAGQAVLVDYRPLSPPYVVRALGQPGRLEPAFADGPEGRALVTAASLYGLRYRLRSEPDLRLPAGTVAALRAATPAPGGGR